MAAKSKLIQIGKEILAGLSMAALLIGMVALGLRADYVEAHPVEQTIEVQPLRVQSGISGVMDEAKEVPDGVPADLWLIFRRYGTEAVPAEILAGVAKVESDFDADCVTGVCYGLMQLHSRWEFDRLRGDDWSDPEASVRVCAEILNEHVARYGSLTRALMVYNEGGKGNREGTSWYSRTVKKWAESYR